MDMPMDSGSSTMSMDMIASMTSSAMMMSATGGVNVTYLPLSNPLCNSDDCLAFQTGHLASQAQISWASQFLYGHWATEFYCTILGLIGIVYWTRRWLSSSIIYPRSNTSFPQKVIATFRSISYRRIGIGMSLGVAGLIFLAIAFTTVASFAQKPYYRLLRGFGSPPLTVRTGMMAVALTPLIVALSGKYNVVTMITGVSHERLNIFHRYLAYICLALSVAHTIPCIVQPLKDGGYAALHNQFYAPGSSEYSGVPPLALLVFLSAFSIPWIRHRFYETFAHSHIIAAIVYLGLMFWHAAMALDSWDYLWATVAVWLFSLFGRLFAKIKSPGLKGAEATLEDIDGEVLKMSIPAFEIMSWKPGQHVFLRFPTLAPLDNHPFTIASSCDETYVTDKHGRNSRTPMMFLIRPHDGMTKSLMRLAGKDSERATRQVVVDGPYGGYGGKLELRFDQIILVAGGTGITAVLPLLTDLSRKIGRERTVLKEIKLIWAVKNKRALSWVRKELQYALATAPAGAVTISYYITSENSTSETSSLNGFVSSGNGDLEKGSPHVPVEQKFLEVHEKNHNFGPGVFGRPILSQIIPVSLKLQRTCLIGCGPKGMNQDLSNAAAASQKRVISGELQEVALHTETFGW